MARGTVRRFSPKCPKHRAEYLTSYLLSARDLAMRKLTHKPMVFAGVRMTREQREAWYIAARLEGVSQSAFLREALKMRVARVLAAAATPAEPR